MRVELRLCIQPADSQKCSLLLSTTVLVWCPQLEHSNTTHCPSLRCVLLKNNCSDALCRATKIETSVGGKRMPFLKHDTCTSPWCHEAYIRKHMKDFIVKENVYTQNR